MATPAKAKTNAAHKSVVQNPHRSSGRRLLVGGRSSKPRRRNTTPATTAKTNPVRIRRRHYRRNPSEHTSGALFAIAGAVVIAAFDWLATKYLPAFSVPVRIGVKVGAGFAVGHYGKRFLGSWAGIAQSALWLSAAYDGVTTYLMPQVNGWLGQRGITSGATGATSQPAVVSSQAVQNTATGQTGTRLTLSNGNTMDVFNGGAVPAASQMGRPYRQRVAFAQ